MNCARCGSPVGTPSCIECPAHAQHPAHALPSDMPSDLDGSAGLPPIGGWLILAAVGLVLSPIVMTVQVMRELLPTLSGATWEALTTPGTEAYRPALAGVLVAEVVLYGVLIAYTLVCCVAFFQRRSAVPRMMTAFWLAELSLVTFDALAVAAVMGEAAPGVGPISFGFSAARTLIWCAYYQRSVRVKRTFVR